MTLQGRRPGDKRVRIERVQPQAFHVTPPKRIRRAPSPWIVLIATFAVLTVFGTALLTLPFATEAGVETSLVDALFMASSAVSTTGLALFDTAEHWSPFGEVVLLLLVQLGGFAFMTGSTLFLLLIVGGRTSLSDRLRVQAAGGLADLGSVTTVVRRVLVFTVVCEIVGAAVLTVAFATRGTDVLTSLWWGFFHSIMAFNNGGLDLFGGSQSLTGLADVPAVIVPIGILILLGGTGFAIVGDVIAKRRWVRLALETKMVLALSAVLLVAGAVSTGVLEWSHPATLGRLEPADRIVNAAFHSVTLRSGGMDSVGVGGMVDESLVLGLAFMFIGGASGSTAGGIKITTFAVLLVATISAMRGDPSATAFGRRISHQVVYRSVAVTLIALIGAFALALTIQFTGSHEFLATTFEAVSALGTTGLSTGLTPELNDPARVLMSAAMFVGRLGPLTLVLALAAQSRRVPHRPAVENVRIG